MLIDATVFIDLFRGEKKTAKFFLSTEDSLIINRIVLMELIRGLRSKKEISIIIRQLDALGVEILEITEEISSLGGELFEEYYHRYGLGIMDALIAASTLVSNEILATHNLRHFSFIKRLKLVKPY